ncbi:MAG: membrane protein insertase YidC [Gemmatimonadota bacterium]
MEKRLLLAVVLMTAAIMFTNLLFPPPDPPAAEPESELAEVESPPGGVVEPAAPPTPPVALPRAAGAAESVATGSVVVESGLYRYVFSTRGAALIEAELLEYTSYSGGFDYVQLVPQGTRDFLSHRLVVGSDTVDLRSLPFSPSATRQTVGEDPESRHLEMRYEDAAGFAITLRYEFDPAQYLISVEGTIEGLGDRESALLTTLGPGLGLHEHPDHRSEREFAVVTRMPGSIDRMPFRDFEGRQVVDPGLTWAGLKDKYFLAAVIAGEETPLAGAVVTDLPDRRHMVDDEELEVPQVELATILPVQPNGTFEFDAYLGPQDYGRLSSIGFDLQEVTPYGYRWLQPIIRPLAAAVLWVLNGLHDTLGIAYGWVLVIFGVMMRIVLWPLNAKAMRAQMKNMGVQPLLQELREKYKNDPQKQQEAMMVLYKEHGFNPLAGCLPMLVPFPVLITLFFVFQNTIAFRGADFLWLPDLSLHDPYYILPIVLVVSMFALQWVSAHLSGIEQNPQMKMMMYFMPIMMGVIFFMLPAGLNLYYAVTQVASIPQQVLIAGERRKAQEELKKSGGPKLSKPPSGAKRKAKGRR